MLWGPAARARWPQTDPVRDSTTPRTHSPISKLSPLLLFAGTFAAHGSRFDCRCIWPLFRPNCYVVDQPHRPNGLIKFSLRSTVRSGALKTRFIAPNMGCSNREAWRIFRVARLNFCRHPTNKPVVLTAPALFSVLPKSVSPDLWECKLVGAEVSVVPSNPNSDGTPEALGILAGRELYKETHVLITAILRSCCFRADFIPGANSSIFCACGV